MTASVSRDRGAIRVLELEERLAHPSNQQDEIDALNDLAWELRISHPEKVYILCQKADALSQAGVYSLQPYVQGLAASLVNQAFVDTYKGTLDVAVSKCLQALGLLHEPDSSIGVRIWFTLGWNSFFLGDYSAALAHGIKALNLARDLDDRLHEAWALDAVASFHGITGDFESAVSLHKQALKVFKDLNEVLGELRTLNNLAVSLHEMRQDEEALEAGKASLLLAQQQGLDMDVCNNSCTIADILIAMGRLDEAENRLRECVKRNQHNSNVARVSVLERMGHLRLLKNDLIEAEVYILQALELAQNLDQQAE